MHSFFHLFSIYNTQLLYIYFFLYRIFNIIEEGRHFDEQQYDIFGLEKREVISFPCEKTNLIRYIIFLSFFKPQNIIHTPITSITIFN